MSGYVEINGGAGIWMPPAYNEGTGVPGLNGLALNTTNSRLAFIIRAPKTGTLHSFEARTGSVSQSPTNGMRFSFQDLNASGDPDTTADQFRVIPNPIAATTWQVPSGPLTSDGTDNGTKRSVTAGEQFACVIDFANFATGDSLTFQTSTSNQSFSDMYSDYTTNGTYSKRQEYPNLALKYDDGLYYPIANYNILPIISVNSNAFASNSTPDERALKFSIPLAAKLMGCWIKCNLNNAADIVLYDANSNALATISPTPAFRVASGLLSEIFMFSTPQTILADTVYRLSVKPTSTSNVTVVDYGVNSTALLQACPGNGLWRLSTRTDAGAWTDANNMPMMGLLFSSFDTGSASGGGGGLGLGAFVLGLLGLGSGSVN